MTPQVVTNVRLDEEANEEMAAAAAEWFSGNKSEAIRELVALGLSAWDLGIRRQCQMRRVDADAWTEECIDAVKAKWPTSEVSLSKREPYALPDEPTSPLEALIYRMVFAVTPDASKTVLMAVEGVEAEYFTSRIEATLESA